MKIVKESLTGIVKDLNTVDHNRSTLRVYANNIFIYFAEDLNHNIASEIVDWFEDDIKDKYKQGFTAEETIKYLETNFTE